MLSSTRITAIDDGDPETEEDLAWLETYDGANGILHFTTLQKTFLWFYVELYGSRLVFR